MRFYKYLILFAVSGCVDAPTPAVDAGLDATPPPLCTDVGCPNAAACTPDGCCSCFASGEAVRCLAPTAAPDACEM